MAQDSEDPTGVRDLNPQNRPTSGPSKGGQRSALIRARHRKANAAIQLKVAGATWGEIAEVLGYPTARQARIATEMALERELRTDSDREAMRRLAGARLDRLLRSVWGKAINEEAPDQMVAISRARELVADHRKLFGLDAPTEVIVHDPTRAELEAWVATVLAASATQVEEYDIIEGEVADGGLAGHG